MKLPMSDGEIAMRYRNALDPKKAVKILAQLNAAGPSDIAAALAREGIFLDQRRMRELYDQGQNDQEIAEEIGASVGGVYAWRYRNQLPANDTTGYHPRKEKGVEA